MRGNNSPSFTPSLEHSLSNGDRMTIDFERALPSIVCLIGLLFLPASARRSLKVYKASQIFDKQQANLPIGVSRRAKKDIDYGRNAMQGLLLSVALFALSIVLLATSGGDWNSMWSAFALFRDAIPYIFLDCFVAINVKQIIIDAAIRSNAAGRKSGGTQRIWHDYTWVTEYINKDQVRIWISSFAISTGIVYLVHIIIPQDGILLSSASSLFLAVRKMPIFRSKLSFQFFVFGPVLAIVAYLVMQGGIFVVVYTCEAILGNFDKVASDTSPTADSIAGLTSPSWGWDKMEKDVASMQWWVICQSSVCAFFIWPVCSLVCLAYRYDAARAGKALVNEQEWESLEEADAADPLDGNGCCLDNHDNVLLLAFPTPLDLDRLPTYKAALYTVLGTQLAGILFDIFIGLPLSVYYPTKRDQLPPADGLVIISFWPLLAYILVILVMILTSSWCEGSVQNLWAYDESQICQE